MHSIRVCVCERERALARDLRIQNDYYYARPIVLLNSANNMCNVHCTPCTRVRTHVNVDRTWRPGRTHHIIAQVGSGFGFLV